MSQDSATDLSTIAKQASSAETKSERELLAETVALMKGDQLRRARWKYFALGVVLAITLGLTFGFYGVLISGFAAGFFYARISRNESHERQMKKARWGGLAAGLFGSIALSLVLGVWGLVASNHASWRELTSALRELMNTIFGPLLALWDELMFKLFRKTP